MSAKRGAPINPMISSYILLYYNVLYHVEIFYTTQALLATLRVEYGPHRKVWEVRARRTAEKSALAKTYDIHRMDTMAFLPRSGANSFRVLLGSRKSCSLFIGYRAGIGVGACSMSRTWQMWGGPRCCVGIHNFRFAWCLAIMCPRL